jgi:uncharacterized protein YjbJ (UPF0337 family)
MGERIDKVKGRVKQAAGDLTGNEDLKRQGKRDERTGKVEGAIADAKKAVKGAGRAIKNAAK